MNSIKVITLIPSPEKEVNHLENKLINAGIIPVNSFLMFISPRSIMEMTFNPRGL